MRKMSVKELMNSESFISWIFLSEAHPGKSYAGCVEENPAEACTVVKAKELLCLVKMNNIKMDMSERRALKDKIIMSIRSKEYGRSIKRRLCFTSIIAMVLDIAACIYVCLWHEDS